MGGGVLGQVFRVVNHCGTSFLAAHSAVARHQLTALPGMSALGLLAPPASSPPLPPSSRSEVGILILTQLRPIAATEVGLRLSGPEVK